MDQPIILRENRSTTTARYSQPSWVLMGYVLTQAHQSIRMNCRWSLLRHDTGLAFTCPRASVSDLSLYSDTFHQSPDSVYSALLPVTQIQMDFAITIDASRFQPELLNLSCQSQVCLMP
jgi:hypothetical protein